MPAGGRRRGPGCRAERPEEGAGAAGEPTSQGRAAQGRRPPRAGDPLSFPGRTKQGVWPGKPRPRRAGRERAGPESWAGTGRRSARCSGAVSGPAACPQRKPLAPTRPGPVGSGPETRGDAGTRGHGDAGAGAAEAVPAGEQSVGGAAARQASRAHTAPAPAWAWPRTPRPCPAPRGPAHAAEWSNQGSRQRLIHSRLNPRTGGRMRELADLFVQSFPPLLTHCFSKHVLKICCTLDPVLALDTQWIGKLTQTYPQG